MAFFAAGWLPLMIIPCPLIKSIYLLSIRDRANRSHSKKKKEEEEELTQSFRRYRKQKRLDESWLCFSFPCIFLVNIFLLFDSKRDSSLSVYQMVAVAHKETVYHVRLLRDRRRQFFYRQT